MVCIIAVLWYAEYGGVYLARVENIRYWPHPRHAFPSHFRILYKSNAFPYTANSTRKKKIDAAI
jgi:hypothetical protein